MCMNIFQKKRLNKITILLLQLIAVGSLFLFFFSKEAIYIFKDFLDRIPLDTSFESLLYRILLPFKMIVNSPSICAVIFLITHIVCITYNKGILFAYSFEPVCYEASDVYSPEYNVVNFVASNNLKYLQTMRLLF